MSAETPYALFDKWFQLAEEKELSYANAMSLATINEDGHPNVRIVLLRGLNEKGLHFYTNYESEKGKGLIKTPYAEVNFYWKSIERQIRVRGPVEKTSAEESDTYFNARPKQSRVGAWASQQSRPVESYEAFEKTIADFDTRFENTENPPRPDYWGGFRMIPERFEFWEEREFRLHKRFIFIKNADGNWEKQWIYP